VSGSTLPAGSRSAINAFTEADKIIMMLDRGVSPCVLAARTGHLPPSSLHHSSRLVGQPATPVRVESVPMPLRQSGLSRGDMRRARSGSWCRSVKPRTRPAAVLSGPLDSFRLRSRPDVAARPPVIDK
jgi:hypothetical protein